MTDVDLNAEPKTTYTATFVEKMDAQSAALVDSFTSPCPATSVYIKTTLVLSLLSSKAIVQGEQSALTLRIMYLVSFLIYQSQANSGIERREVEIWTPRGVFRRITLTNVRYRTLPSS